MALPHPTPIVVVLWLAWAGWYLRSTSAESVLLIQPLTVLLYCVGIVVVLGWLLGSERSSFDSSLKDHRVLATAAGPVACALAIPWLGFLLPCVLLCGLGYVLGARLSWIPLMAACVALALWGVDGLVPGIDLPLWPTS